ncbi:hypothetical protein CKA32_005034 [Geitlerinema sp. FC II]|nr:hypothetical protein CKA32_005034 [Geitlerinema sp. FC II]
MLPLSPSPAPPLPCSPSPPLLLPRSIAIDLTILLHSTSTGSYPRNYR